MESDLGMVAALIHEGGLAAVVALIIFLWIQDKKENREREDKIMAAFEKMSDKWNASFEKTNDKILDSLDKNTTVLTELQTIIKSRR